ncbi:MAG TPA: type II toxin-antitoxin system VapC family toxin [Dokdonella sp.]
MAAVSEPTGIALDCSAALALFLDDEQAPLSSALLDALPECEFWVPQLWQCEFSNALLMAQRKRRLTPARAQQILAQAARLPLRFDTATPSPTLLFELASTWELTTYDAMYLELARRRDLVLATLDKQLVKAAAQAGVVVFGDASPTRRVREPRARHGKPAPKKRKR